MTGEDLTALARRAQAGDAIACHELLVELYRHVRKHVYFNVGSGPLAEEVVQETMLEVFRGIQGFRGDTANPRSWALTIATRTSWRQRKKEARYQLVEDGMVDAAVFDLEPAAAAELVVLRRALARLSPKKRDAFVLMAIFEMSADEAGKVLGVPADTAASRYRFARKELAHLEKV